MRELFFFKTKERICHHEMLSGMVSILREMDLPWFALNDPASLGIINQPSKQLLVSTLRKVMACCFGVAGGFLKSLL